MEKTLDNVTTTYDKKRIHIPDNSRFHRYVIDEGRGIAGTIYFPKDFAIPKSVTINFEVE